MRRPPLLGYLTFNRLGYVIQSITALLQTTDDFELCFIDNFSQDKTWDYINSLTDPRIKIRKRLDSNVGGSAGFNHALLNRKEDQDFVTVETCCVIKTKNFISIFNSILEDDNTIGGLSGTYSKGRDQLNYLKSLKSSHPENFKKIGNYEIYKLGVWGFCLILRHEVLNKFGFFDEVSYGGDIDFNERIIKGLNKELGYVFDVECAHLEKDDVTCIKCMQTQSICLGNDLCKKYYDNFIRQFYDTHHLTIGKIITERTNSKKVFCDTIFRENSSLTTEEKEIAERNIRFFSEEYEKHIKKINI